MVKVMTLRLPNELDKKLEGAIEKGNAVTKTELIRRAIDDYIERHPNIFS